MDNWIDRLVFDWIAPAFVGVIMIVITGLVLYLVVNAVQGNVCMAAITCRDAYVQECLALERYTRAECIELAAGK